MGRKPTGRTTKLIRVPTRFEAQVKAFVRQLKAQEVKQKTNPVQPSEDER